MDSQRDLVRESIDLIKHAASKIETGYFKIGTTYEPSGIVRERVFAYELYHQIRSLMRKDFPLSLNGEIDKRGHIDFKASHRKNPDFVFHIPGIHEGNTLVIQIKGSLSYSVEKYLNDLKTMLIFISLYKYSAGVFLLYNHTYNQLRERICLDLKKLPYSKAMSAIYILSICRSFDCCSENILSEMCV